MQSNRGFLGRVESPELGVGGRRQLLTCRRSGPCWVGAVGFRLHGKARRSGDGAGPLQWSGGPSTGFRLDNTSVLDEVTETS